MRFSLVLRNGVAAGAAAGLTAALFVWLLVEPVIRRALVIEESRSVVPADGGHAHEEEVVSRTMQVLFGGITAVVAGVLFGLLFAVVFAKARHRLPGASDFGRATWLALLGFGAFVLMPALKIPANPPAVGDPGTVNERTLIYVLAILVGVLVVGAVAGLDNVLVNRRVDSPLRLTLNAAAGVVLVGLALWLIPDSPDSIPSDVPADLIWDFRLASLAQLGALWAVLGAVFGVLSTRNSEKAPSLAHASSS